MPGKPPAMGIWRTASKRVLINSKKCVNGSRNLQVALFRAVNVNLLGAHNRRLKPAATRVLIN